MKSQKKIINVSLPQHTVDELDGIAVQLDMSRAQLLRRLVRKGLKGLKSIEEDPEVPEVFVE